MNKLIHLSLALLFAGTSVFAQQTEHVQEVSTPVQSAIIYLYGAEVSHSKLVHLVPGRNKVIFIGLSPKLSSKSIQVNATGDVSILAISDQINYMSGQKESDKIRIMKDSVKILTDLITQLSYDKEAYDIEKGMLMKNESIGGNEKGVVVAELKLAADLFRSRMKEIHAEIFRLENKMNGFNITLGKLNQQLAELNAKNTQHTAEISILMNVTSKTSTTIDLKYLVVDAGWAPSYDLRAEDINLPIELKYRAKVFNNTGMDWNDIKIKLSTADPTQSASKPQLNPWNLDFFSNTYKAKNYSSNVYGNAPSQQAESGEGYTQNMIVSEYQKVVPQKPNPKIQFVEVEIHELSAEFDIKTPYTIPADSKPYIVEVTEFKLPATFQHFSVPKIDRNAFLLARITGWEDLNLIEGPANVYYGGTYVGQSYIQPRSTDDTLDLSLGRDDKVLVTRTKVKEFSSKKLLGNQTKETFTYEMQVKNNRKTPMQIEILDQLPVSMKGEITVEAIEISRAEEDLKTGELKWKYSLQPGEIKKITLSFSVKYPRNSKINLQKTRSHMNVRFL